MPYFIDLNTFLHQSSLLIQAYPTARVTTKYSLPRKEKRIKPSTEKPTVPDPASKREPAATLTLKTFHPETGICLKYKTDKAQEVGRLMMGMGRLARGEVIELPSTAVAMVPGDKMEVDSGMVALKSEDKVVTAPPVTAQPQAGGGGKNKKKKGKK